MRRFALAPNGDGIGDRRFQRSEGEGLAQHRATAEAVVIGGVAGITGNIEHRDAIELRFDVRGSPSLPEPVRARLYRLSGNRLTMDGVLVLVAQEHRSQEMNRQAAVERLLDLIREAAKPPPPPRKKTRPTYASKLKRLEGKAKRSTVKSMRGRPRGDD